MIFQTMGYAIQDLVYLWGGGRAFEKTAVAKLLAEPLRANLYAKTPLKMFSKLPSQKECCTCQPIEFLLEICHTLASNSRVSALWQ